MIPKRAAKTICSEFSLSRRAAAALRSPWLARCLSRHLRAATSANSDNESRPATRFNPRITRIKVRIEDITPAWIRSGSHTVTDDQRRSLCGIRFDHGTSELRFLPHLPTTPVRRLASAEPSGQRSLDQYRGDRAQLHRVITSLSLCHCSQEHARGSDLFGSLDPRGRLRGNGANRS
jgi:hypothetical protein